MPRTARVKFPATDVMAALGLPPNTSLVSAQVQYGGSLVLSVEHPDLIDHDGMKPPVINPKFGSNFEWDQKPPVLMGEDGAALRAELQRQRDEKDGKA